MPTLIRFLWLVILLSPLSALSEEEYGKQFTAFTEAKAWSKAEALLKKALAEYPNSLWIDNNLSWVLREQKKHAEALAVAEKALGKGPAEQAVKDQLFWSLLGLGWSEIEGKNLDAALEHFLRADAVKPGEDWGRYALGQAYNNRKEFEKARPILEALVADRPDFSPGHEALAWTLSDLGWAAHAAGQDEEAAVLMSKALELAPDKDWVINGYGASLVWIKKPAKGLAVFEAGRVRFPAYKHFAPNIAWALVELSEEAYAAERMDDYLDLAEKAWRTTADPADFVINAYALALVRTGHPAQAIPLFEQGQKRFPGYTWFAGNLVWALQEKAYDHLLAGEWEPARLAASRAWDLQPEKAWSFTILVRALSRLADRARLDGLKTAAAKVKSLLTSPTTSWESAKDFLFPFGLALGNLKDSKTFEETAQALKKRFPGEPVLLNWTSSLASVMNHLVPPVDPEVENRSRAEARLAMRLWESSNPGRPVLRDLVFPLKGIVKVVTQWDSEQTLTHNGFGEYSYDLMSADAAGNRLFPGTNGQRNEDYLTFGQPIYAVATGTVTFVEAAYPDQKPGVRQYDGNFLEITTADGIKTWYAHLKQHSTGLKVGDQVQAGDKIGEVGNTGYSSGPHLHFAVADKDGVSLPYDFGLLSVTTAQGPNRTREPLREGWLVDHP